MEKSLCRPPLCHDLRPRRAEGHSVSGSMAPSGRLLLRARCRGSAPAPGEPQTPAAQVSQTALPLAFGHLWHSTLTSVTQLARVLPINEPCRFN